MQAREIGSSLFMLVLAIVFWIGADRIPVSPLEGQIGAAGFPKMLSVSLGFLALLRMAQVVMLARRAGGEISPAAGATADGSGSSLAAIWRQHGRAAGMLALGIAYIVLLPILGYVLSIALLVAAIAIYSGRRPSLELAVVTVAGAGVLYVLFVWLLKVPMPSGIWANLGAALG